MTTNYFVLCKAHQNLLSEDGSWNYGTDFVTASYKFDELVRMGKGNQGYLILGVETEFQSEKDWEPIAYVSQYRNKGKVMYD